MTRKLICLKSGYTGVWDYTIADFERRLAEAGVELRVNQPGRVWPLLARGLAKMRLLRQVVSVSPQIYFALLMGPAEYRLFPVCWYAGTVVYCYDCWPDWYSWWEGFFRRHRIRVAFFSARQSAEYFRQRLPQMTSHWLPEAVEPDNYQPEKPLGARTIDVLEAGRRNEAYHQQITAGLAAAKRLHLFEQVRGQIVFPTYEQFVAGLGETKISICFPASLTHPERAGAVETVTHRYFEAMASGCLIVGHCPAELRDLFGYNPVIEADLTRPLEQLAEILARIEEYEELKRRNYQRLLAVGTWQTRAQTMLELLAEAKPGE